MDTYAEWYRLTPSEKPVQVVDLSGLPSPSTEELGLPNLGCYAER